MHGARLRRLCGPAGSASLSMVIALAGCGLGQRPTLAAPSGIGGAPGTPTGNAAADKVLTALEGGEDTDLTATYALTAKFGDRTFDATVVRSAHRRSVTIGDTRFLSDGDDQTCDLAAGSCEPGINEARVSDSAVTSQFYAASPARQLRVSLSRATGEPVGTTESIGGRSLVCVTVPVVQGEEVTCATEEGVVGRWDTAYVRVELTGSSTTADPAAFATTR